MPLDFKDKQKTLFARIKNLKKNATIAEKHINGLLKELGVNFIFQKGFIAGNNYCIVDFYLPKPLKICLEINGGYHSSPRQKKRDYNRNIYLQNRGFKLKILTNEEALTMNSCLLDSFISK